MADVNTSRIMLMQRAIYELERAYAKHGKQQWGRHEFYGILQEEMDEVWDAIKGDYPKEKVDEEIIQMIAVCVRYLETGDRYGFTGKPDILDSPVDSIFLPEPITYIRASNCLRYENIRTVRDLTNLTIQQVLRFRNCGTKTAAYILSMVKRQGLEMNTHNAEQH